MLNYNISDFLTNEVYKSLVSHTNRKGDSLSLPFYKNLSNWSINTYYPKYTSTGDVSSLKYIQLFELNYKPYKTFTNYIESSFKDNVNQEDAQEIAKIRKYFMWLDANAGDNGDGKLEIEKYYNEDGTRTDQWNQPAVDKIKELYAQRRTDGKFGYYHLGPNELTEPTEITKKPEDKITTTTRTYQITPLLPRTEHKYPGWSDWIPLTAQRIGDIMNIINTANLKKLQLFPLEEPKHHEYKVTNGYTTRQLIELQKADLRNSILQDQTSDLNANLKKRMAIEDKIDQLNALQLQIKSNEFNLTSKEAQAVANQNSDWRVETANNNRKSLAAKWNSIINANIEASEKNTASRNTWIGNMYANFGEYLLKKRLNANARKTLAAKRQLLDDLYNSSKDYYTLRKDPTIWKDAKLFCDALLRSSEINFEGDEIAERIRLAINNGTFNNIITDLSVKQWIADKLSDTETDSNILRNWQNKYKVALAQAKENADYNSRIANKNYYDALAQIDLFAINQWGIPTRDEYDRRSVLMGKQGTKIDRLTRMLLLIQKESESVRKQTTESNKQTQSNLNKSLDRLEKEELLLLRAVFK